MGHERGTLEAVTNARAGAVAAGATGDPAKIGQAENVLSQSLRSLFAVSENYPDLKAISAFTNLQENLTATEDKIEFSRRFYNGNVRDYNIKLQTLPTSLIAGMLGFKPFGFFQADEARPRGPAGQLRQHAGPPASLPPSPGASGPARLPARQDRRPRASGAGRPVARPSTPTWPSRSRISRRTPTPPPGRSSRCPARGSRRGRCSVQLAEPRTSSPSNRPILAWSRAPWGTGYQRAWTPPATQHCVGVQVVGLVRVEHDPNVDPAAVRGRRARR